jgi:hypothetical protein
MDIRTKASIWGVVTVIGIIMLVLLARDPIHPPKARAQRISAVNHVSAVSVTITNASALPAVHR